METLCVFGQAPEQRFFIFVISIFGHVTSQSEINTTATYMLFSQLFSASKRGIWNI